MACIFLRQVAIILAFGKMMFFMGMELPIILKEIYRTKVYGKMGNLKNENHILIIYIFFLIRHSLFGNL